MVRVGSKSILPSVSNCTENTPPEDLGALVIHLGIVRAWHELKDCLLARGRGLLG